MGVAYGSSACMLSCSPILAPLLVHNSGSLGESMRIVTIFSTGRIVSYIFIATTASFAAAGIQSALADPEGVRLLMGSVMMATALWLIFRQFYSTRHRCGAAAIFARYGRIGPGTAFAMGMLLSLNLCTPLLSLVSVAAAGGSTLKGAIFGLAFGLGTVLVSLFFYGFILASIAKELLIQFKRQKIYIETAASLLLLLAGMMVATGHLTL